MTDSAGSASRAIVHRVRPTPCVQANRAVPLSSSLARIGAPANAPTSTGTALSSAAVISAVM